MKLTDKEDILGLAPLIDFQQPDLNHGRQSRRSNRRVDHGL